jgi:hypothetical protein
VITPREGCKLVVRSSKGVSQEDYFVDAVEVVSFGHSFFFRSQERPKSFLVPVSDYEILELKETRMVLKNVSTDRSIKIGGGREAHPRSREDVQESESRPAPPPEQHQGHQEQQGQRDRKRDNKRRRGRRGRDRDRQDHGPHQQPSHEPQERSEEDFQPPEDHQIPGGFQPEASAEEKAPSFISKLFPPPPTLIKETLTRYKPAENDDEAPFKEKPSNESSSYEESLFEHPNSQESEPEDDNEE